MNTKTEQAGDFKSNDQPVGIDYFLYSCFEFESTCKALPRTIVGDDRWPVMLSLLEGERGDFDTNSLPELINHMIDWYSEKFPYLTAPYPINFKTLAEIVPATVMMAKDFDMIVKEKTGSPIPTFKMSNKGEIWQLIEKTLNKKFAQHSYFFSRYLKWVHAQDEENEIEIGNRPPVGKYAPNRHRPQNRNRSQGAKSGNSVGSRNSQPNYRGANGNRAPGNQRPRKDTRGRKETEDHRHKERKRDPKMEQDSIKQVIKAVQILNEKKDLDKYTLPPANSYYRRLQHKQIKEEGLFSCSEGEGQQRAVVITRNKQENSEN